MSSKKSLVLLAAAVVLLASPALAAKKHHPRYGGNNARQTALDEQYARKHPTIVPGTPARPNYGGGGDYGR